MAFLMHIAILVGWTVGFRSQLLVVAIGLVVTFGALYFDKNKKNLFNHFIIINIFALVSSGAMLFCILRFDTYNPFNDIFTYLVHGQWLQTHAFSEIVETSGFQPALTQVAVYQTANLRMGGSFLLGWVQSMFGAKWSYLVYPVAVSLPLVAGSLAVGYCASLCGYRRRWHGFLIGMFTAVSFNGIAYGSATFFLPMVYGLSFAVSFLGLFGSIGTYASRKPNWHNSILLSIPAALLLSALVYSYPELAPFCFFACVLAGAFFLLDKRLRKQFVLFSFFLLMYSFVLMNKEIFRAVKAIVRQSEAVAGWAVNWSLYDFIGHSFGLRSGSGDVGVWFFDSKLLSLIVLFFFLATVFLFFKNKCKNRAYVLLPCAAYVVVSTLAFLYFRYFVSSPWPIGTGQSWSQFKIANWVGPFVIIFIGVCALYTLRCSRRYSWPIAFVLIVCILVGIYQNYIFADNRTKHFRQETGYDQSSSEVFLKLRNFIVKTVEPTQSIYLSLEGIHHKIRQMVAYFLLDFKLSGNWSDDGYLFPHLPPGERDMPVSISEYIIGFQDDSRFEQGVERFGNLNFTTTPLCLVQLISVEGGHDREMDGKDWWYWTPNLLSLRYRIRAQTFPKLAVFKFQFLSLTDQTIEVIIRGKNFEKKISHESQTGWGKFKATISIPGPEMSLTMISSEDAVPISETDSRLAKFLIKNAKVIPYGCNSSSNKKKRTM
jgi:hypothetical protein